MINKVILVGNLGADPEIRNTASGTAVANLRIATTSRKKDADGNWSDQTEWHSAVCFGRTAENVGKFLQKGRQVYVEGRLQTRKWQDRDGNDRWSTEVVAHEVKFLGGRGAGANDQAGGGGSSYNSGSGSGESASGGPAPSSGPSQDDEIPF
jgi:single-strand DNA-binding protein